MESNYVDGLIDEDEIPELVEPGSVGSTSELPGNEDPFQPSGKIWRYIPPEERTYNREELYQDHN